MLAKVMVTGCNGLLGQKLVTQFNANFEILGVDLGGKPICESENFEYQRLDICNRQPIKKTVLQFQPDFIINVAAYTDVDGCEQNKARCWQVNVEGVENLAYAGKKVNAKIIHISTDYVFSGKKGSYTEKDVPDPLSYYGKAKLASENVIKSSDLDWVIIRTAVLYGKNLGPNLNFATWLIENLSEGKKLNIVDDQFGNPTLADNLAAAIRKMISLNAQGLYHIAGREVIDRYHFALKLAQTFNFDSNLITPIKTTQAKQIASRPLLAGLVVEKAQTELGLKLLNVEEGLNVLKYQLSQRKN